MRTDFYVIEGRTQSTVKPLSRRAYSWVVKNLPHVKWQDTSVALDTNCALEMLLAMCSRDGLSFVIGSD